jgi:hypothetical protein
MPHPTDKRGRKLEHRKHEQRQAKRDELINGDLQSTIDADKEHENES